MGYHVDYPDAEFHEIIPHLYLGGLIWSENGEYRDPRWSSVASGDWDYVVSAHETGHPRAIPRCDTRLVFFKDTEDELEADVWARINSAVRSITKRYLDGEKILVRCQIGYNRSGLIMSMVLVNLGFTASEAIDLLRIKRSEYVLVNPVFEGYIRELGTSGDGESK